MAKSEKIFDQMANNPAGDFGIDDIEKVCRAKGISVRKPSSGSHYTLSHESLSDILTVPSKRPIKPVYIRKLVAYIRVVEALKDDGKSPI